MRAFVLMRQMVIGYEELLQRIAVSYTHLDVYKRQAPFLSRPCIGLAPGANATPLARPSGVAPVFLPYITLEVMVSKEDVYKRQAENGDVLDKVIFMPIVQLHKDGAEAVIDSYQHNLYVS